MNTCKVTSVMSLCNPMDDRLPGPSVHGDPADKKRSGLPGPSLGDLPDTGTEALSQASPALAGRFFTTEPPGKPLGIE